MRACATFIATLACFAAGILLSGCSIGPVAGGLDTGNPYVVAASLTREALKALHTGTNWQPSTYLDTSNHSPTGMSKSLADSLIVTDTVALVYDTVTFYDTLRHIDTVLVRDTNIIRDTLTDTIRTSLPSDTAVVYTTRIRIDTVTVTDTLFAPDTFYRVHKEIMLWVITRKAGVTDTIARAITDTLWIDSTGLSRPKDSMPVVRAAPPVVTDAKMASLQNTGNYQVLSYDAQRCPTCPLLNLGPNNPAIVTRSSQLFLSRQRLENGICREKIDIRNGEYVDIRRYNPFVTDTVESLLVSYHIYPADQNLGTSECLRSIFRSAKKRLDTDWDKRISLTITADAAQPSTGYPEPDHGLLKATIDGDSASSSFDGIVDKASGINGMMIHRGKAYQVIADTTGRIWLQEVTYVQLK